MIENTAGILPVRPASLNAGERAPQASMLDIDFGECSDIGKVRDTNEDSHGYVAPANPAQARSHGWLFVLADGVEDTIGAKLPPGPRWIAWSRDSARPAPMNRTLRCCRALRSKPI